MSAHCVAEWNKWIENKVMSAFIKPVGLYAPAEWKRIWKMLEIQADAANSANEVV